MGNCLKTQLKETVSNSNLLKIGEMVFYRDVVETPVGGDSGNTRIYLAQLPVATYKARTVGCTFADSNLTDLGTTTYEKTTTSKDNTITIFTTNVEGKVCIDNKYGLGRMLIDEAYYFNIDDLAYCSAANATEPYIINNNPKTYGNIVSLNNMFKYTTNVALNLSLTSITGNIEEFDFSPFTNKSGVNFQGCSALTGSIENLTGCTNLKVLNLNVCNNLTLGNAERLFEKMYNAGRITGTLTARFISDKIHFNGIMQDSTMTVTFDSTSANKISVSKHGAVIGTWDGISWTYA